MNKSLKNDQRSTRPTEKKPRRDSMIIGVHPFKDETSTELKLNDKKGLENKNIHLCINIWYIKIGSLLPPKK